MVGHVLIQYRWVLHGCDYVGEQCLFSAQIVTYVKRQIRNALEE